MKCKACLQEKSDADFYVSNKARCKECVKASCAAHRQANLERVRAHDRMRAALPHRVAARAEYGRTAAGAEAHKAAALRWAAKHPERMSAHAAVKNAVRTGKLQRWPCEVCGEKAQGHHPAYDAPLLVVWLCPKHHKAAHAITDRRDGVS